MTTVHRFVSLAAQPAQIRMASDGERDYFVMPVVALVGDAVVRPLGSEGPEYVPLAELSVAPGQWAGRPIVADHPAGGTGSANDPQLLVAQKYGSVYYPEIRNGKLCAEAWLDPERAALVGGDAERVVEIARRALAGETVDPVEVSVGCWVSLIRENGASPGGVPYEYRWSGIASDHLAVGLNGASGACDVPMGCGLPRAAQSAPETNEHRAVMRAAIRQEQPMNLMHRILSGLGFRQAEDEGQSNSDLEGALWAAIYSAEPAVQWIADVYQDSQTFVYATAPSFDVVLWWRRGYAVAEDGAVTLTGESEPVEPVKRYEPLVAAADKPFLGTAGMPKDTPGLIPGVGVLKPVAEPHSDHPAAARAACECQTKDAGQAAPVPTPNKGVNMDPKISDLVGRLIANTATPFTDKHRAQLEAFGEQELTALDAALQHAEPEPEPDPEEPEEPDDSERIPKEELADLRAAAAAHKRQEAAKKAALIARLKGKQAVYSEDRLKAMSVEQLEEVAQLAKIDAAPERDYSGRGLPVTGDTAVPPPPDIREAIRTARGIAA